VLPKENAGKHWHFSLAIFNILHKMPRHSEIRTNYKYRKSN